MTAERGSESSGYQPYFLQFFTLSEGQAINMEMSKETRVVEVHKYGLDENEIPEPVDYLELTEQALGRYAKWLLDLPKPKSPEASARMFEVARFLLRAQLMFDGKPFTP